MALYYKTGEVIQKDDRIRLSSDHGTIEFIVDPAANDPDPQIAWFIKEHGKGVLVSTTRMGSVFTTELDEDLHFISRAK